MFVRGLSEAGHNFASDLPFFFSPLACAGPAVMGSVLVRIRVDGGGGRRRQAGGERQAAGDGGGGRRRGAAAGGEKNHEKKHETNHEKNHEK